MEKGPANAGGTRGSRVALVPGNLSTFLRAKNTDANGPAVLSIRTRGRSYSPRAVGNAGFASHAIVPRGPLFILQADYSLSVERGDLVDQTLNYSVSCSK